MPIEEEIRELEQRFAETPESRLFLPLADALRRAGELERAVDICARGLESFPDFTSARVLLGQCLSELGQAGPAREAFEFVLAGDGMNFEALKGMGRIAADSGEGERALEYFTLAREIEPQDEEVSQAVEVLESGAQASGTDEAELGEASGPGEVFITHTLGDIYRLQGYYQRAFEVYSKLLEKYPGDTTLAGKIQEVSSHLEPVAAVTVTEIKPAHTQAAPPAADRDVAQRIDDIFTAVLNEPAAVIEEIAAEQPESFVNMFERWIKGLRLLEAK